MTDEEIIALQDRVGTKPDGFWGPKSKAACVSYLRSHAPELSPWPPAKDSRLREFYGEPWDNDPIIYVDAPEWMRLYNDESKVQYIACHEKVADSLLRCLHNAYMYATDVVSRYYGCHVDRPMRGGHKPSLHAYGAAIDLDALTNRNRQAWPISATMPLDVMVEFAKEGWLPAGALWGRDAMHFQATRW